MSIWGLCASRSFRILNPSRQLPLRDCLRQGAQTRWTTCRIEWTASRTRPFCKSRKLQQSQAIESPIASVGAKAWRNANSGKTKSFPDTSDKSVAYWLLGSAASVFGIVVFGGLTRLTESGLSITEWRPVTGSVPPLSATDWEAEFARYRASPEYIRLNPNMTLAEFKKIYWMEWTHRLWGRVIGVTFLVPTIYFIVRRKVTKDMAFKLVGICGLIGFQGFIGWWMVKSGLKEDLFAPGSHPRVSQYRLAAHLGTAFVAYAAMLRSGLSILRENRFLKDPAFALTTLEKLSHPSVRRFRIAALALTALIFTTAMSGALVAGLDAGLIYNEFPWMGLGLTPPKAELFDPRYSRETDQSDLIWRNALENPSLVQLDHRILATTTFFAVLALFAWPRLLSRGAALKTLLPRDVSKALTGTMHMANLQVILGISTLIYLVPTPLAALHQAGALALLSQALILTGRLSIPRRVATLIRERVQSGKSASVLQPAAMKQTLGSVEQTRKLHTHRPLSWKTPLQSMKPSPFRISSRTRMLGYRKEF